MYGLSFQEAIHSQIKIGFLRVIQQNSKINFIEYVDFLKGDIYELYNFSFF